MEKKLIPRRTSSPVPPEKSPVATKSDSFLDDMELFSHNLNVCISEREADRFVTKRNSLACTMPFAAVMEDGSDQRSSKTSNLVKTPTARKSGRQEIGSGDGAQPEDFKVGMMTRESKVSQEKKPRSKDNKVRSRRSEPTAPECQNRLQNELGKSHQDRKSFLEERSRRSGSYKEIDCSSNTSDIPESVALLSAIKEIVSTYTKEEGIRINRVINELHILRQASLLKNLMFLTDETKEIKKALQLGGNIAQLRTLMNENEILKENFALLRMKYEDVQRRLEETECIKEENAALKLKLQELSNRKSN